jgi:hypothetical protein
MMNLQHIVLRDLRSVSIGKLVGLGVAATVVRLLFICFLDSIIIHSATSLFILVIAGAIEGLAIGALQYRSSNTAEENFELTIWIGTSTIGYIVAWFIILQPALTIFSILSGFNLMDNFSGIAFVGAVGLLFGAVLGLAQYLFNRKKGHHGVMSIISKGVEWTCLSFVAVLGLLIFNDTNSVVIKIFAVILTCLLSGLIQVFAIRDASTPLAHAVKAAEINP